jgi:hypothetical protein
VAPITSQIRIDLRMQADDEFTVRLALRDLEQELLRVVMGWADQQQGPPQCVGVSYDGPTLKRALKRSPRVT